MESNVTIDLSAAGCMMVADGNADDSPWLVDRETGRRRASDSSNARGTFRTESEGIVIDSESLQRKRETKISKRIPISNQWNVTSVEECAY
jgi:hypothetical protein